jgi:cation diffusion facilitator family transporter
LFITGMKIVVGLATGSLGILSEAAHSGLDLVAALMTLFAVNLSDKPADDTHHYGHGKIEGLSALFEVLLLLVTCVYIIYEAIKRLLSPQPLDINIYAFAVMFISIVVDVTRSRALYRVAKKYKSQALEADALHFASDIWSSAVVIVGLVCYKYFDLQMADAMAALVVSVLVIVISIRLAKRTVDVLLDRAPIGMQEMIENEVNHIKGVDGLENLRIRTSGARLFIDMKLKIDSGLSLEVAHGISDEVERKISDLVKDADIVIHTEPSGRDSCNYDVRERIIQLLKEHNDMFSGYHNLKIFHYNNRYIISMHLVMDGGCNLDHAHEVCDHIEKNIKYILQNSQITIHVEPAKKRG